VRILVTGGSGFLGRQIVAALRSRGATVIAPGRQEADLRDAAGREAAIAAARADALVHAAWVTAHDVYWHSPDNLDWAAATIDLARRFAMTGGWRFVLVGTCAEYDWTTIDDAPWSESRPCRPHTPYGAAKVLAWTVLQRTVPLAANARVFWPIGPHERPERLLPSLVRAVHRGQPIATGPAALTRDPIDVRDAGRAIAELALARAEGEFNIGGGKPVSLDTLARAVAGDAFPLVRLGARPMRAGEPLNMVADITRLRRTIGFTPQIPLAQTIADLFAECRAAAWAA
jgi:nucleoside-diphosphate-sugar epimerase